MSIINHVCIFSVILLVLNVAACYPSLAQPQNFNNDQCVDRGSKTEEEEVKQKTSQRKQKVKYQGIWVLPP